MHDAVVPLWRPRRTDHDDVASLLVAAGERAAWVPWPLGPGWRVSDIGVVADRVDRPGAVRGAVTGCSGTNTWDGEMEILLVTESPGTGLGARVAGLDRVDPGTEVGEGVPAARLRLGTHPVALWSVSSLPDSAGDRAAFAGEAWGRWLWLVLRPASAALLLADDWILRDLAELGPALVGLSFGGTRPGW